MRSLLGLIAAGLTIAIAPPASAAEGIRAGASAVDITPLNFPVLVNGGFLEARTDKVVDPLHARCLVLERGDVRVAIVVVDSCMMPRDLIDDAKRLASEQTGIPADRMLVSATHTHSAPAAMGALGCRADPAYVAFLPGKIVEAIVQAAKATEPARVGWAAVDDHRHTHTRRWIRRPDRIGTDPFGEKTVRANMHPGYQNPDAIAPSGPVDPALTLLSVQSADGRPLALLANYSMHYVGAPALSADYYGKFAEAIAAKVGAGPGGRPFVAMMSQGTSGDQMWMDYGQPSKPLPYAQYAQEVAEVALDAYRNITYLDQAPLAMAEATLSLRRRTPDAARVAWAKPILEALGDGVPRNQPEVYAREVVEIQASPERELKLQALRVGDLGITAIPNEVYAITGLKLKGKSPLPLTMNIELANGSEGYIPPPEQHALGGYTTWPARTAGLEVQAEPRIVETLLGLLETVAGRSRRPMAEGETNYARAVLGSKPIAYWRLGEIEGWAARDASGGRRDATFEPGVALYLEGADAPGCRPEGQVSRAVHFAGGRLRADLTGLSDTYSVEFWFWNGLPDDARPVTGYLFSRGPADNSIAPGDHLGLGGTHSSQGRLIFFNGNERQQLLAGTTTIPLKSWNHVVLTRDGETVTVYLNGKPDPEIRGKADRTFPGDLPTVFVGGRSDGFANFEGKIDEVAVYGRVLTAEEVVGHHRAAVPASADQPAR